MRFIARSFGYLQKWAFHKSVTLLEKNAALVSVPQLLMAGRSGEAKAVIADAVRHDMMLVKQTAAVTGLYLKVQRYENDENDKMDFLDFQKAFNNSLVALSIMFGRYRDAWNTADEANGSMTDKL